MRGPSNPYLAICIAVAAVVLVVACTTLPAKINGLTEVQVAPISTTATPSIARQQWEDGGRAFLVGKLVVVMPADCSEARTRQLVANVRFVLTAFEQDYCPMAEGYTVFITDKKNFQMEKFCPWVPIMPPGVPQPPQNQKIDIIGVCCPSAHEIAVVSGSLDCLPALYHEFCHAALDDDPDHRQAHWKRFDARGDELAAKIRARWH